MVTCEVHLPVVGAGFWVSVLKYGTCRARTWRGKSTSVTRLGSGTTTTCDTPHIEHTPPNGTPNIIGCFPSRSSTRNHRTQKSVVKISDTQNTVHTSPYGLVAVSRVGTKTRTTYTGGFRPHTFSCKRVVTTPIYGSYVDNISLSVPLPAIWVSQRARTSSRTITRLKQRY